VGEVFNSRLAQNSSLNPSGVCGVPIGVGAGGAPTNIFPAELDRSARGPAFGPLSGPQHECEWRQFYRRSETHGQPQQLRCSPRPQNVRQRQHLRQVQLRSSAQLHALAVSKRAGRRSFLGWNGRRFLPQRSDQRDPSLFIQSGERNSVWDTTESIRIAFNSTQTKTSRSNSIFRAFPSAQTSGVLPQISIDDGTATIGSSGYLPAIEKQNSFVLTDNLTWIHGRHSAKFGTEIRNEQFTLFEPSAPRGHLEFRERLHRQPRCAHHRRRSFRYVSCLALPTAGPSPIRITWTITAKSTRSTGKTIFG
jgi:hypothetical protein